MWIYLEGLYRFASIITNQAFLKYSLTLLGYLLRNTDSHENEIISCTIRSTLQLVNEDGVFTEQFIHCESGHAIKIFKSKGGEKLHPSKGGIFQMRYYVDDPHLAG